MKIKKIISALLVVTLCLGMCACGAEAVVDDAVDQAANVVQAEDENVLAVKGGTNSDYPGITYEEAFENFFGSPTWKYFKGTQKGADDDGDGEPDYTIEDIDVVEFTGSCTYQDVKVKALIQFELDKEAGTFKASYLSFNEVPQSSLMLAELISTVFETYMEDKGMSGETDETNEDMVTDDADISENTDSGYDNEALIYAGTYEGLEGTVIYFTAYSSVEDDEIGKAEIYYDGELLEAQSVYLYSDWSDQFDGDYDAFYVMYLDGYNDYLGFYEVDGTYWMDFYGEEIGSDSLAMTEHYES